MRIAKKNNAQIYEHNSLNPSHGIHKHQSQSKSKVGVRLLCTFVHHVHFITETDGYQ